MSTQITLDDIRAAAEAKYGSYVIVEDGHKIELRNVMRLSADARDRISALQDEMQGEDLQRPQEEILAEFLAILCATEGQAKKLTEAVGGDLAIMSIIFDGYTEATQLGEAEPSQS